MAKTFIQIEGQTLDPAGLKLPASREHRDAWTRNGDVVEVDNAKVARMAAAAAAEDEARLFEGGDIMQALADAVVDLVFAAKDGQLTNLNRGQVQQRLRQRVRHNVRKARGLPEE